MTPASFLTTVSLHLLYHIARPEKRGVIPSAARKKCAGERRRGKDLIDSKRGITSMFGKINKNQVAVKEMFGKQSEKVRMASKTAKTDEKMFGSSDAFSTKMQDLKINHAKRKNERKRRRQ